MDLSLRRHEFLRPCLNQEYSTLWLTQHPVTTLLFGDDFPLQLANIKTTNRIVQSVDGSHSRRHTKAPYEKWSAQQQSHYGGKHFLYTSQWSNYNNRCKCTKQKKEAAFNTSKQWELFSRNSNLETQGK